jgi:hypothetical protein
MFCSGDVGCKYSSKSQLPLGKLKAEQTIAEIYISGEILKGRKGVGMEGGSREVGKAGRQEGRKEGSAYYRSFAVVVGLPLGRSRSSSSYSRLSRLSRLVSSRVSTLLPASD